MADISIDQVTTTDPTENGVFDVLMRSVDSHLDKQYIAGRIKGADYATVYLGALQAVLQQSIAFVLSEQKAEKEIDAIDESIAASQANTTLKNTLGTKQGAVYDGQAASFAKEARFKVFKALLDLRTTGMTQELVGLDVGENVGANALANVMLTDVGISTVGTPVQNIINDDVAA